MTPLAHAAMNLGLPVFACDDQKRPIVAGGFKSATTNPDLIGRMFGLSGAAMIGVPTGEASGLVVIDVDVKAGQPGMAWLNANANRLPSTRTHRTQSGGLHLLFRAPQEVDIRNSASRIAPGVDVRGSGGYIIAPPSLGYAVADLAAPAEMPDWLLAACMRPEPVVAQSQPAAPRERIPDRYAEVAFGEELARAAGAPDGTRNETMHHAAIKIGRLVGAGLVSRSTAEAELGAIAATWPDLRKTLGTIKNGLDYGIQHPREVPERQAKPAVPDREVSASQGEQPEAKAAGPNRLSLVWFDDIAPILDAKDFVQGVLIEGSAAVVYGESNAGKTFWATDLALHVAAAALDPDMTWNGRRIEGGGVVYAVLEGGFGFRNRVTAWRSKHYQDGAELPFAAIQSGLNLLDPEADTQRLIDAIREAAAQKGMPIKLLVVDTLARAFAGGNENSSEDMGALVKNMDRIREETGVCVMFIHHSGKDQAKGARGHSSLRAAIDTEIEVKADEETGIKTAEAVKQREMKKGERFAFTLDVAVLGINRHGEDVTSCTVKPMDVASIPEKRKAVAPTAGEALTALKEALAKRGQPGGMPDIPAEALVVSVDTWRAEFYSRSTRDNAEANKKAFQNGTKALIKARTTAVLHNRAWIVRGE